MGGPVIEIPIERVAARRVVYLVSWDESAGEVLIRRPARLHRTGLVTVTDSLERAAVLERLAQQVIEQLETTVEACLHCGRLIGERPGGWVHLETGRAACDPRGVSPREGYAAGVLYLLQGQTGRYYVCGATPAPVEGR